MTKSIVIHAELFSDAKFVELSPLARLLYLGLCYEANEQKQLTWDLQTLKYRYLPGDICDMYALEDELITCGLINFFHEDNKTKAVLLDETISLLPVHINNITSQQLISKGAANDA